MKFREKKNLCELIDEYHWDGNSLVVYVFLCNIQELLEFVYQKLSDGYQQEHGCIRMEFDGMHICIPNFDVVLEYMELPRDEIVEMFEEE